MKLFVHILLFSFIYILLFVQNVVAFVGYVMEQEKLAIVAEYCPKGSVESHYK